MTQLANTLPKQIAKNTLNTVFFSKPNQQIIHNALRYQVYRQSNRAYLIGPQSNTQVIIVMRSIYLQYGKNQSTNIREQVEQLNNLVIETLVPKLISNVKQYITYTQNLDKAPQFMDHPRNVSNAGDKTLVHNLF
jgi:hypothetical protein